MSAERSNKKPHQSKVTVAHFVPPYLRTVMADGVVITSKIDPFGVALQVNFTRIDFAVQSETFEAVTMEAGMQQIGASTYNMPSRKVVEASVTLRPDHAFQIAVALISTFNNLSPEIKAKYQIPEIGVNPGQTTQGASA